MTARIDLYQELGLPRTTATPEIDKRLARFIRDQLSAGKGGDSLRSLETTRKILGNERRRRLYDMRLDNKDSGPLDAQALYDLADMDVSAGAEQVPSDESATLQGTSMKEAGALVTEAGAPATEAEAPTPNAGASIRNAETPATEAEAPATEVGVLVTEAGALAPNAGASIGDSLATPPVTPGQNASSQQLSEGDSPSEEMSRSGQEPSSDVKIAQQASESAERWGFIPVGQAETSSFEEMPEAMSVSARAQQLAASQRSAQQRYQAEQQLNQPSDQSVRVSEQGSAVQAGQGSAGQAMRLPQEQTVAPRPTGLVAQGEGSKEQAGLTTQKQSLLPVPPASPVQPVGEAQGAPIPTVPPAQQNGSVIPGVSESPVAVAEQNAQQHTVNTYGRERGSSFSEVRGGGYRSPIVPAIMALYLLASILVRLLTVVEWTQGGESKALRSIGVVTTASGMEQGDLTILSLLVLTVSVLLVVIGMALYAMRRHVLGMSLWVVAVIIDFFVGLVQAMKAMDWAPGTVTDLGFGPYVLMIVALVGFVLAIGSALFSRR